MNKPVIKKQSLIDWTVEVDGKVFAWIKKLDLGYNVRFPRAFFGSEYQYFERDFKSAKAFALEHL